MTDLAKKWGSSAIHKTQSETSKSSLPRRQEPGIFWLQSLNVLKKSWIIWMFCLRKIFFELKFDLLTSTNLWNKCQEFWNWYIGGWITGNLIVNLVVHLSVQLYQFQNSWRIFQRFVEVRRSNLSANFSQTCPEAFFWRLFYQWHTLWRFFKTSFLQIQLLKFWLLLPYQNGTVPVQ